MRFEDIEKFRKAVDVAEANALAILERNHL